MAGTMNWQPRSWRRPVIDREARRIGSTGLLLAALLALGTPASAQITDDGYLRYVPLSRPRIVAQTQASVQLGLFGDPAAPAYRDVAPRDGIDDARAAWLGALARRFAPLMVRNTSLFPIDLRTFYEQDSLLLHVDDWDITRHATARLTRGTIDLSRIGREPCVDGRGDSDDCRLVALLGEVGPRATTTLGPIAPERETLPLLYIDLPGSDEKSWKAAYANKRERFGPAARAFVHPFVAQTTDGYELVLQYWFFYPMNDGPNNHEGDWEHINVVVSPRSLVTTALDAARLRQMIEGPLEGDDPLVIRRIEYYFHHFVSTLDLSVPNAYAPREAWLREVETLEAAGRTGRRIWRRIRQRAWRDEAETVVNTQPLVWIGGDGIGIQTTLEMPGLRDRDGHASYPFQGYYKRIGPGDVGERVLADFDHQAWFGGTRPSHVEDYADDARLALVPDWERVHDLVREDPAVRRAWAWLLLPMRFGFPATRSPVAGMVQHADMGNVSVVGPAFNDGWNRVGESRGYERYDLVEASWARPLGFTDSFFPRLGFLNAPIVYFLSKPPLDLAWRTVALPVRAALGNRQPTFLPASMPAERLVSLESGVLVTAIPDDYLTLFLSRDQLPSLLTQLQQVAPDDAQTITPRFGPIAVPVHALTFHLSPRFSAESAVTWLRGDAGFDVAGPSLASPVRVRADLRQFDFQGSFRMNLTRGAFQPYVKYGNGLTWYQLRRVTVNGVPITVPDSPRYQPRSTWRALWFNETVLGGGVDWHRLRVGRAWLGLKASYTLVHHDIGFEQAAAVEASPELARLVAGTKYGVWRQQARILASVGF